MCPKNQLACEPAKRLVIGAMTVDGGALRGGDRGHGIKGLAPVMFTAA